jgi:hypothetical protein
MHVIIIGVQNSRGLPGGLTGGLTTWYSWRIGPGLSISCGSGDGATLRVEGAGAVVVPRVN